MAIAVTFLSFFVIVKLTMRTFEIALLLTVSPVFFAMWVSDATRQYFKKFMLTFASVVFELAFVALCYAMLISWVNSQKGNFQNSISIIDWIANKNFLMTFIVMIAGLTMMVKPPKILKNLIS